ncbi:MAG: type II secretion system protein [Bermanella sp.]
MKHTESPYSLAVAGFTLMQLVVAITLLSILIVVALPRMSTSYDSAHDARVTATGGALASAVILLRAQWVLNGSHQEVDAVTGFGEHDIATTAYGWPSDAGAGTASQHRASIAGDGARCVRLWRALLATADTMQRPTVATQNDGSSDYWVSLPRGSVCQYRYAASVADSAIEYNLQSGSVVTIL